MNKDEIKSVVDLLKTVKEAVEFAKLNIENSQYLIEDSLSALSYILNFLVAKKVNFSLDKILNCIDKMNKYKDLDIPNKKSSLNYFEGEVNDLIKDIEKKRKLKAVFLPYKASMWTSLESVWKAACEDENCEAVVVPIPYHDIDENLNKLRICYEGEMYPDYVPVIKFWEYDISKEKPDMIFIHNPYDDTNTLTRVPEEYYSRNLKKYTDNLVYIPYYTNGSYEMNSKEPLFGLNHVANYYVDKIIAENNNVKKKYEENSAFIGKVLALGSPKFDSIYNLREKGLEDIGEWKDIINNKKVFLLITTLTFYSRMSNEALNIIVNIVQKIAKKNNCILIWRPHPLEETWIRNTLPNLNEPYKQMKNIFNKLDNTFIDLSKEYKTALYIADGVISVRSSMVNEVMAMGKSVYLLEKYRKNPSEKCLIDDLYNYDIYEKDISEYIEGVISGYEDTLYSKRVEVFNNCVENAKDGSSGKKIYEEIKKNIIS